MICATSIMRQFWRHNIYQDGCTLPLSVVWISQWSSNQNSRVDPSHKSIRGHPQMIHFGGLIVHTILIVQLWISYFFEEFHKTKLRLANHNKAIAQNNKWNTISSVQCLREGLGVRARTGSYLISDEGVTTGNES